jgi:hypothetical protein
MELPFSDYTRAVTQLEGILVNLGIVIKTPSPFQHAREILSEMEPVSRGELTHTSTIDHRENWRRGFSLGDLAIKLVTVSEKADFATLRPHLELLAADSDLSLFSFAPKEEQQNDLVFELRVAACALQMLTNCKFDNSRAKNSRKTPDVIGDFGGVRWAIECKTLHPQTPTDSQNPEGFLQRVKDGRDQIEAAVGRGDAQSGLVVINMKNSINHDSLWPAKEVGGEFYYLPFGSFEYAKAAFASIHDQFVTAINAYLAANSTKLSDLFAGRHMAPYVLFVYSGIVGIVKDTNPTFTMLRVLACEPGPQPGAPSLPLIQIFNNCLQDAQNHPLLPPEAIG